MKRWIFKTPWGDIRIHNILRSDADDALHDHPMSFWTFILKGSYCEVLPLHPFNDEFFEDSYATKRVFRRWLSIRWVEAEQPHRLILEKPVWTLVLTNQSNRDWGFYPYKFGKKHWVSEQKYFGDKF
jgi:hypothetical protein